MNYVEASNKLSSILNQATEVQYLIKHFQNADPADDVSGHSNCKTCHIISKINHRIYFSRTGFTNSGGKYYMWIGNILRARETLVETAELNRYKTEDWAIRLMKDAINDVEEILNAYNEVTIKIAA